MVLKRVLHYICSLDQPEDSKNFSLANKNYLPAAIDKQSP